MRIVFLADIHANLEALNATLLAADAAGYDKLVILGDLVGYGADPVATIEIVSELIYKGAICIKGNHDEAACIGGAGMSENARFAINWTQTQLHLPHVDFLNSLALKVADEDRLYVHASAATPAKWPYIRGNDSADRCLEATSARLIFAGHTHIPTLFHGLPGKPCAMFAPQTNVEMPISSLRRAVMIVGSVGQPRDGIPAASFCVYDTEQKTITMKRVAYDMTETARKIRDVGLPFWLANRLMLGK